MHEVGFYRGLRAHGLDLLVTGHRHDQELLANSDQFAGASCIVTGGGGGITSEASPGDDRSQWYGEAQYGFYDITITKDKMLIESINWDGTIPAKATIVPARR